MSFELTEPEINGEKRVKGKQLGQAHNIEKAKGELMTVAKKVKDQIHQIDEAHYQDVQKLKAENEA